MRTFPFLGGLAAFGLLVAGCSGPTHQINPNITVYDRETVADRPIRLPANYNTDSYGRLCLALDKGTLTSNAFDDANMSYMNLRMQSELAKLKRFTVIPLHGVRTADVRTAADLGMLTLPDSKRLTADLLASWNFNIHAEEERDGRDKVITFVCSINLTCKDLRAGTIKFTKDLDFRVKREQSTNRAGMVVEGFQYRSRSDVQGLLQEVATQAAIRIANELGNEYPVGGRITGMLGLDMMTLDKGVEQGVAQDMQMVLYTTFNGVDIPLANLQATPSSNTSQLEVWRLNTDNKYAAKVLKQMEEDPNWLIENKLYAVGYGMAMPPEWQTKNLYLPE